MEGLMVRIHNPFALREALQIAVEVVWPDISPSGVLCLRAFVSVIPLQLGAAAIPVEPDERAALLACSALFRHSRARYWLRGDFTDALSDLERELSRVEK